MRRLIFVIIIVFAFCLTAYAVQSPNGIVAQNGHEREVVPWVPLHPCVSNSIYSQPPHNPGEVGDGFFTSDLQLGYKVFDDFQGLDVPVCNLHWWGTNLIWNSDLGWTPCDDESVMTFLIEFWTDNSGMPGEIVCSHTIRAERIFVGSLLGDYPLYTWNVVLEPCCQLASGWISIFGVSEANPNCEFGWATSPIGNGLCWQRDGAGFFAMQSGYDVAFCLTPQEEMDLGDVVLNGVNWPGIGYPTLPGNPGHMLSGIAWLGAGITGEFFPLIQDLDQGGLNADDGVIFPLHGMYPCQPTSVTVIVTAGPNYSGQSLYLEAWKDGNLDGDFCDTLCPTATHGPMVPEWFIQDAQVYPGVWTFPFIDPGIRNVPPYDGVYRFRLCSIPTGWFGFGLGVPGTAGCQGTWGVDYLGEVEDYYKPDYQLAVELLSFGAEPGSNTVTLTWATASESQNDHFDLVRDGELIATLPTKGNDATGHSYSYVDNQVNNGTTYSYVLFAEEIDGQREQIGQVNATPKLNAEILHDYVLWQNYPNPFNAATTFAFELKEAGMVHLNLFNIAGQKVAEVISGNMTANRHEVQFDATNLPTGVYIYRLDVNGFSAEKKMLLIK